MQQNLRTSHLVLSDELVETLLARGDAVKPMKGLTLEASCAKALALVNEFLRVSSSRGRVAAKLRLQILLHQRFEGQ